MLIYGAEAKSETFETEMSETVQVTVMRILRRILGKTGWGEVVGCVILYDIT